MKFCDAVTLYLNGSSSCKTPSSRRTARSRLSLLGRQFPHLELDQYSTVELTAFCHGGAPAPGTVKGRKSTVRSFFEWCTYMKLTPANPASDLKFTVRPGTQGVRQHNWLTEAEVGEVMRSCPTTLFGQRTKVLLMIGFMMGLRREELSLVRWSQFSHDLTRITFVRKGSKLATLGVPPQVRVVLQAWRRQAPVGTQVVFPRFTTNRFNALEAHWDQPIADCAIGLLVAAAGKRAGLTLRPHDMRRSFAGILEAKGVSISDISRLLSHSNIGITSVYLEKNPARVSALADVFTLEL